MGDNEKEAQAAGRLLGLVARCRRVAFMKSTADAQIATHMCRAAGHLLRSPPKQGLLWQSLAFLPRLTEVPSGGSPAFAAALEEFSLAVRECCGNNAITQVQLPAGTTSLYLPEPSRHLPVIIDTVLRIKATAGHLYGDGPQAWKESELWSRMQSQFTAQNPLLQGAAALERKLLQKPALLEAETIQECLHPAWPSWMEAYAESLVALTVDLPRWAPHVARRKIGAGEETTKLLRKMADEALLLLLKMRKSSGRPGLALTQLVTPALMSRAGDGCFPRTLEYVRRKVVTG